MIGRDEIRALLLNIKDLPTLPTVVARIFEVVGQEKSGARDLASVISHDQSISAKVLNLANSAFYGFSRRVRTIDQAVVLLGFNTVKGLALSASVFKTLSDIDIGEIAFDRRQFWIHAIACAVGAKLIARQLRWADTETPFVAGVLHDVGKVVMDGYLHDLYVDVVIRASFEEKPVYQIEKEELHLDHAEVGGWLTERWHFPDELVDPIRYHHHSISAGQDDADLIAAVHLADTLAKREGIGLAYESQTTAATRSAMGKLKVRDEDFDSYGVTLRAQREEIEQFFSTLSG